MDKELTIKEIKDTGDIQVSEILDAFKCIDQNGIPPKREGKNHYFIYNNKQYPLKVVTEVIIDNKLKQNNPQSNYSYNNINTHGFRSLYEDVTLPDNIKLVTSDNIYSTINNDRKGIKNIPLNQILYGPPGTGKTYNTVIETMKIITFEDLFKDWYLEIYCKKNKVDSKEKTLNDYLKHLYKINQEYLNEDNIFKYCCYSKFIDLKENILNSKYIKEDQTRSNRNSYYQHSLKRYEEFLQWLDYEKIRNKFNDYKKLGQIEFVTFHQSYSYEEFIEGIKPDLDNHNLQYKLEDGIFKNICEHARPVLTRSIKREPIDFSNTKVFKMSLGDTMAKEDDIYNYCIENNLVSLGFKDADFSQCKTREDFQKIDNTWGGTALERFIKWMDIGDIIIISNGNRNFRAIAQVKSDYIYDPNTQISYSHFRKVEWLYAGDDIHYSKINEKMFSQQSIYGYFSPANKGTNNYNPDLKTEELNKIITGEINEEISLPHVLIIDEINRGNISKIFGELITLIEEDKRDSLSVKLPYSQNSFTVPKNLYIIGTMNTSDRSIASIDIALRRRFKFIEMMPKKELVADFGIGFADIFENINNKIKVLLDRDHQIGHSYFINTKYNDENGNNDIDTLKEIWFSEILPLLNEYFYCDWEKLQLIIPGFIKKSDIPDSLKNECEDTVYEFKTPYEIENFENAIKQENFNK